jgi:hypothetical protein
MRCTSLQKKIDDYGKAAFEAPFFAFPGGYATVVIVTQNLKNA